MCIFALCTIACNSTDGYTDPLRNQEAIRKLAFDGDLPSQGGNYGRRWFQFERAEVG
jgi:hypothetical protein